MSGKRTEAAGFSPIKQCSFLACEKIARITFRICIMVCAEYCLRIAAEINCWTCSALTSARETWLRYGQFGTLLSLADDAEQLVAKSRSTSGGSKTCFRIAW